MRQEVKLAGFGGQGIALAGYILGKACALYDGYEAIVTQAYGPEARGGASHTSVIVSDEPIDYPFVHHPDILVTLSQEAYTLFTPTLKPDGRLIVDEELVTINQNIPRLYKVPATAIAEKIGRRIIMNMVTIGFFSAVVGFPSFESISKAVESSIKPRLVDLNLKAIHAGYEFGTQGVKL